MIRRILQAALALTPVAIVLRFAFHVDDVILFVVSAGALIPLAWIIGEFTEHAAEHTGPGVGGFLNASFGNAPELIITLFAIADGLPDVVRGSLIGSIVSNILVVLGMAMVVTREERIDRRSLGGQVGLMLLALCCFLIPSAIGWTGGDTDRHSLAVVTLPVAIVMILLSAGITVRGLRRHRAEHQAAETEPDTRWSLRAALVVLAAATVATALVGEVLVHSLEGFGESAGLSQLFIAAVIVALVGNAAEHGGAVIIARKGKVRLASEIALSSGAQVAVLLTPVIAILSWAIRPPLTLAFRPVELAALAGAIAVVAVVVRDGRGTRREGIALIAAYAVAVLAFGLAGD